MDQHKNAEGLAWQISVWDRMVPIYTREIDKRFEPIVERVIKWADLKPGQDVLDLGTGTGSVALRAAAAVAPNGRITALDISPDMLAIARRRAASAQSNITFVEGRAEAISAEAESIDAVLASLSLMYVIDREAAAREIARVLRPGGHLVGAVWAGPERADIVLLQQTAGSFAPQPPVPGGWAWRARRSGAVSGTTRQGGAKSTRRDGDNGVRVRRLRVGVGRPRRCHSSAARTRAR